MDSPDLNVDKVTPEKEDLQAIGEDGNEDQDHDEEERQDQKGVPQTKVEKQKPRNSNFEDGLSIPGVEKSTIAIPEEFETLR